MRKHAGYVLVGAMALVVSACATQTSKGTDGGAPAAAASSAAAIGVPAPPSSPLSKVKLGMHKKQVSDVLGQPTDENTYATGKAWIPWYFGNDARRTSWYYKGMGRVVFADGNIFGGGTPEVLRIDYDPTESGVAR